jgi:AraC-like DNA-binding protein
MRRAIVSYRELAPRKELQRHVYAFFSFVPAEHATAKRPLLREILFRDGDSFCSPMFAAGNTSIVFNLGDVCDANGRWLADPLGPHAVAIGPMTKVGPDSEARRPAMLGAYFRPGQALAFTRAPLSCLKDRIVDLHDLWGAAAARLSQEFSELEEAARIERFELELLRRLQSPRHASSAVDASGVAAAAVRSSGGVSVEQLAASAGVSRQHLTRIFRERVGVAPKTFCQLARFHAGLSYAGRNRVEWADAALALGYADQSHMINEFRRFSSLTPERLASGAWFHPFIERVKTGALIA